MNRGQFVSGGGGQRPATARQRPAAARPQPASGSLPSNVVDKRELEQELRRQTEQRVREAIRG
jgi:hypothetical protein